MRVYAHLPQLDRRFDRPFRMIQPISTLIICIDFVYLFEEIESNDSQIAAR